MLWNHVFNQHIALCSCCCKHIRTCLDHIRYDRIAGSVQGIDTLDPDHIGSCSFDVCSHAVQEVRHIDNVRLFRCILNRCISSCHRSCHHDVDGGSNGNHIQENVASMQICRTCHDCAMTDAYLSTKCAESL